MDDILVKIQKIIKTDFSSFAIILLKYFYKEDIKRIADDMIIIHNKYCHLLYKKEEGKTYGYDVISYKDIEELIRPEYYEMIVRLCKPAKDDVYRRIKKYWLIFNTFPHEEHDADLFNRMEILIDIYNKGLLDIEEVEKYEMLIGWKWECSRLSIFGTKCLKLYNALINDQEEYDTRFYKEVVILYKTRKMSPYLISLFASVLPV